MNINITEKKLSKSAKRRARRNGNRNAQPSNAGTTVVVNSGKPSRRRNRRRSARRTGGERDYSYLDSLLNPEAVTGVKIPDIIAYPTGTFQVAQDGVITSGVGGDSVSLFVSPCVGNGTSLYPVRTYNGTSSGALNVATNYSWGGVSGIIGLYKGFRPVSAMAELEFIGPSSSDGGQIAGHLLSAQELALNSTPWSSFTSKPGTEICPLRNGMRVLWKPEDNSDFEFVSNTCSKGDSTHIYPCIEIAVTGLPSAVTYIRFHTVVNFEAIPGTDATNLVHVEASPYDIGQLRSAFEWAAQTANNIYTLYNSAGPYLQAASGIAKSISALTGDRGGRMRLMQ